MRSSGNENISGDHRDLLIQIARKAESVTRSFWIDRGNGCDDAVGKKVRIVAEMSKSTSVHSIFVCKGTLGRMVRFITLVVPFLFVTFVPMYQ